LAVLQGIATFLWAGKTPLPAARRGDAVIGWAAATQFIWSLRDGRRRQVSVRILIVYLSGCLFRDEAAIVEVCCKAWNHLVQEPGRVRSLAERSWIHSVNP